MLGAWLAYLGIDPVGSLAIDGHFTTHLEHPSTYEFIRGWAIQFATDEKRASSKQLAELVRLAKTDPSQAAKGISLVVMCSPENTL